MLLRSSGVAATCSGLRPPATDQASGVRSEAEQGGGLRLVRLGPPARRLQARARRRRYQPRLVPRAGRSRVPPAEPGSFTRVSAADVASRGSRDVRAPGTGSAHLPADGLAAPAAVVCAATVDGAADATRMAPRGARVCDGAAGSPFEPVACSECRSRHSEDGEAGSTGTLTCRIRRRGDGVKERMSVIVRLQSQSGGLA